MKIRSVSLLLIMLFWSMLAIAQTHDLYDDEIRRVQPIIRVGVNATNTTKLNPSKSGKESMKPGYNVGLMADVYVSGGVFIQSGVSLTTKGARIKGAPNANGNTVNMKLNAMYLQVPVMFAYKIAVADGYDRINLALGVYYARGMGGDITGISSEKIDAFGNEGICKDSSFGYCSEAQYETPKFLFFFGIDVGLSNIIKQTELTSGFRNKVKIYGINLGAGYKF